MNPESPRILLLFLDGVGIGPDDPDLNPFLQAELPVLRDLLGGRIPTLRDPEATGPWARAFALDATLGVEGLPQSGTGQVALLTGENAPRAFGGHFGPWPPVSLRALLAERNLLRRAREAGLAVAFANAYPRGWPGDLPTRRHAAPPLAALSAGVLDRHADALDRQEAVASEIVNDGWIRHFGLHELPRITPREAGRNLARIAGAHDLTLFAHYQTDHAGHRGGMAGGIQALERVDAFLGGILEGAPRGLQIVGASDHGNVEDVRGGHTRNPALGFVVQGETRTGETGSGGAPTDRPSRHRAELPAELPLDLAGVTPWILRGLGVVGGR